MKTVLLIIFASFVLVGSLLGGTMQKDPTMNFAVAIGVVLIVLWYLSRNSKGKSRTEQQAFNLWLQQQNRNQRRN